MIAPNQDDGGGRLPLVMLQVPADSGNHFEVVRVGEVIEIRRLLSPCKQVVLSPQGALNLAAWLAALADPEGKQFWRMFNQVTKK